MKPKQPKKRDAKPNEVSGKVKRICKSDFFNLGKFHKLIRPISELDELLYK